MGSCCTDDNVWGWHVSLDGIGCPYELVTDVENFKAFVVELANKTNMKLFGDLIAHHFAAHNPDAAGYSFNVFQETSNICAHLVDKNGGIFLDCFSCKPYVESEVIEIVQKYFKPAKLKSKMVLRTYPE